MDPMERTVLELLVQACGDPRAAADPDLDLYGENLLDSFAWVQLLEGLEDAFGLELWPTQVSREDTATPGRVVALVRRHTGGVPPLSRPTRAGEGSLGP